ncbi:MAG: molybdopterin-dependent oxidoreductase [Acidobacteriota bacterium]
MPDLARANCVLIQGSSMAEAHPVGFRFVVQAKERGAFIIHVDPRYSRTSALADLWIPLRAGSDLVLLGALIRQVIQRQREGRLAMVEYLRCYTNASFLVLEDFQGPEELDGLFSGWDPESGAYDASTWAYQRGEDGEPLRDETLEDPQCVLRVMERHFARYTPERVERACGVPPKSFHRLAEALLANSTPERTSAFCYAVGWTHHSKGVQVIRAAAILQLLLGNIGRPGGGILALRGHASIQGSTDIPTLFDILPGYLPSPEAVEGEDTVASYVARHGRRGGWWCHMEAYLVSLMKAWYGEAASAENDWGFGWLPRRDRDHSHLAYFLEMLDGGLEGLFVMGQNPAVGGQNAKLERRALGRLKWMVVRDLVEIETASFWKDSPEVLSGELAPEDIETEVFLFPAAAHAEKAGTFTQTMRWLQWREKAVDPPGEARSELWFIHQLAKRLIARAKESEDPRDEALRALDWWYPELPDGEPDPESVLAEINGYRVSPQPKSEEVEKAAAVHPRGGSQLAGFAELAADGSTACGCWIYSGVFGPDGVNRGARRQARGPLGQGWGWAWPADRRILYNRASARPDGSPWSEEKALVWWSEEDGWTGEDVPDFPAGKAPQTPALVGSEGLAAHRGSDPFLMQDEGVARLFVPQGLKDGPLPTHYEPLESPVSNPLYREQGESPLAQRAERELNPWAEPQDPRYPHVLTTYRLTEHHTAGGMSRFLRQLVHLQPELFAELPEELAEELGVEAGGWVTVRTPRGAIEARALPSRRMQPLKVDGRWIYQVALPFHWGQGGLSRGDVVNDLIPIAFEPNVRIHEAKALLCAVEAGRRE